MAEDSACQVPLLDLLRAVPRDARGEYEHGPTHHQMIPYGRYCAEAAADIARLAAERDRANVALHSLTPGGSEFANDPAACVAFVRGQRDRMHDMILRFKAERDAATKRAEEAERHAQTVIDEQVKVLADARAEAERLRTIGKLLFKFGGVATDEEPLLTRIVPDWRVLLGDTPDEDADALLAAPAGVSR